MTGGSSSTPGRRQYRAKPTGPRGAESSGLEAENANLRAEVNNLRGELRVVMQELKARSEDLRELSSLLILRQGQSSSSLFQSGTAADSHQSSIAASANGFAEAFASRSSIMARLEADNERYRAHVAEQDRLLTEHKQKIAEQHRELLELKSEMQAQKREGRSQLNPQATDGAMLEAESRMRNGAGNPTLKAAVVPRGNIRGQVVSGAMLQRVGFQANARSAAGSEVLRAQARSEGSLLHTPPPAGSPRVDPRALR